MAITATPKVVDTPTANKLVSRRLDRIHGIVVHASGDTDLDRILKYYHSSDDKVCPHFLVETTGTVRRFCDLDRIANHAAMYDIERAAYVRGYEYWARCRWDEKTKSVSNTGDILPNYADWRSRWPDLTSPLDLPTGNSPNAHSVGIEMQSPPDGQETARIFQEIQYQALAQLLAQVGHRLGLRIDKRHVFGHSDTNPLRRSTKQGGYDPGKLFDWNHLFEVYTRITSDFLPKSRP